MIKFTGRELWAFDAEWVPDPDSGRRAYGLPREMPDDEVLARMWQEAGATSEDPRPYLKTVLCRVVSVAAVVRKQVRPQQHSIELRSLPPPEKQDMDEAELLSRFLTGVGKAKPQLVGFNSQSADLPIMVQRAMVNELSLPDFCARPAKPWEGVDYFARGSDYNIDLKEEVGGWGRATPSLHEIATACGIPGKIDTAGADVVDLWTRGEIRRIVQYNECDALTTFLVWSRLALLAGQVSPAEHAADEEGIRSILIERGSNSQDAHLRTYAGKWDQLRAGGGATPVK
jgi:predicted PolB exonuclease-like 3'-5' exonuclease